MRLKELRKGRKLKQVDVAEILSCSQGVYSRYESEEREPPFDIIKKLSEFYGVTVDYLMGVESSAPSSATPAKTETPPVDERAEGKMLLESMEEEQYKEALHYLRYIKSN